MASTLSVVAAPPPFSGPPGADEDGCGSQAFEILSDLAHMEQSWQLAAELQADWPRTVDEVEAARLDGEAEVEAEAAVICNYDNAEEGVEEEWRDDPSVPRGKQSRRRIVLWALAATVLAAVGAACFLLTYYLRGAPPPDNNAAAAAASLKDAPMETNVPTYAPSTSTSHPTYLPTISPTDFAGDLFLFSGQSNVIGHTTKGGSLVGDDSHWLELKYILSSGGADMESKLYEAIEDANALAEMSDTGDTTSYQVEQLLELYNDGLLDDIDAPLEYGRCSFRDPSFRLSHTDRRGDISGGSVSLAWDAGCGYLFGSEFTFGRYLEFKGGYRERFEVVKTAVGGTRMFEDWFPDHGTFWNDLSDTISQRGGSGSNWKAFVWYQGENDSFTSVMPDEEDTSITYLGNLTALVDRVRSEMFDASAPGTWECPEEIPTIVVQLASWPGNDGAERIRNAQADFCERDPRAALVTTNDLSRYFHLDAASFLIMGRRVARAYEEALEGEAVCSTAQSEAFATSELV